ncbi:hypothetical protein BDV38DRAFT_277514 [Aspergillus pseudotamarii]|uniref:BZIP domain-containing protein n=1 Tax=Aspergillus pseudotamarii TaxID=132259 RepID=A0A5N6TB32_ASPPS|nr:uncharacterized protein BDV38DRAFT_277514 [Aspergillus pseudotamarii]KAE8143496.1 hypothetical protein BDV38DRAFT_277514 [Aspergillus pseudotamarii]
MLGNNDDEISKCRKRVITPARKEQNRVAQRVYRQRQKERLQREKQTARPSSTLRVLQPTPTGNDVPTQPFGPMDCCTADVPGVDPEVRPSQCLAPMKLTLDHFFPLEKSSTTQNDDVYIQLVEEHATNEKIPGSSFTSDTTLPHLYQNTLELTHTMLLRACLHNAQSLGISIKQFFSYECMSLCSPFYRANTTMADDPQTLIKNVSNPSTPTHLQPTLPQILFPHHPLLDLLPLPALRTRAVMLAATAPTLIDAVDLKRDIVGNAGIVCRGEQPWDMHSWVAAPWFLKKWKLLLS